MEREEAIRRIQSWNLDPDDMEVLSAVIPELAESEDEKIRKWLIVYLENRVLNTGILEEKDSCKEAIAWLEKQVEHYNFRQKIQVGDQVTRNEDGLLVNLSQLERVSKPATTVEPRFKINDKVIHKETGKLWTIHWYLADTNSYYVIDKDGLIHQYREDELVPADKVEPKFKVGDWVMLDKPVLITKVKDMPNNTHQYWTSDGTWFGDATKAKLWTVQDAKDGDVLANDHHILILKELRYTWASNGKPECLYAYCGIKPNGNFESEKEHYCFCGILHIHPATKKQRDLLFKKMKEAGYEWDAEKKELKKIEQKPAEEYNITGIGSKNAQGKLGEMIKNLKPINEVLEQKPAWSKEDESMRIRCIGALMKCYMGELPQTVTDEVDWLKSLKERVLPKQKWNEKDSNNLEMGIQLLKYETSDTGINFRNWLKSLKDRVQPQPKQEWSEEDIERYESCLKRLGTGDPKQPETINSKWFKEHVNPQKQWKPTEMQLKCLKNACDEHWEPDGLDPLYTLYQDLKKLRGE